MSDRSNNTMVEGLQKLLVDIGKLKLCADADMEFIVNLETTVIDKLKNPVQQMVQNGDLPQDGAPQAGGPPPGGPMQSGGLMGGTSAPNPDELRRLLGHADIRHMLPGV